MKKLNIHSLEDLILALNNSAEGVSCSQILNQINFGFEEIEPLCFWDVDQYSKIQIGNGDDYELVLICWGRGQRSEIHNHEVSEAWTYLLKGELTEEVYSNNNLERNNKLTPQSITLLRRKDKKQHRFTNSFNGTSVSLHIYYK